MQGMDDEGLPIKTWQADEEREDRISDGTIA